MARRYKSTAESSVDAFANEALGLTRDFIRHLYNQDFSWCMSRLSKDFLWVGAHKDYYTRSLDEFATFLEADHPELYKVTVADEEYTVASCTERACCVVGRYLVLTDPDDKGITSHGNRCTLVWHRVGRRNLLEHLHVSAPVDYLADGENYPIQAGSEMYQYMRSLRKLGTSRKSISLYDVDGTLHWVHPSQIIYLEANRKRTIVHCMTKDIVVGAVIRDATEMVDNKIMRVHRSYAVNRDHVVELKGGMLLLDDGTSIAIPAKRIADVRAALA